MMRVNGQTAAQSVISYLVGIRTRRPEIVKTSSRLGGQTNRRAFLRNGTLILSAGAVNSSLLWGDEAEQPVSFGLITDLHYADKPPAGSRHYRDTPDKLAKAAERFANDKLDFVVELGDFIDADGEVTVERDD